MRLPQGQRDHLDRLIELRDDIQHTLVTSDGTDPARDATTRERLADLNRLIALWLGPQA